MIATRATVKSLTKNALIQKESVGIIAIIAQRTMSAVGVVKLGGLKMSRLFKHEFDTEKKYSEADMVKYLESFMGKVLCGDYLSDCPWGIEENKNLYISIFAIKDGRIEERLK